VLTWCVLNCINPLDSKGNCSATSNKTKLVHWPLMGGLLHLVQRGGAWAGCGPAQAPPRVLAVPNATAHPSTASVPNYQSLYCYTSHCIAPLLCDFNVAIKGLSHRSQVRGLYATAMSIYLFVCSFVRLSSVKFVKWFSTWQHLAASGGFSYRLRYTCFKRQNFVT